MKLMILGGLVVGSFVGFWVGPALASTGITYFGTYMALVVVLLGCNLITACRS